MATWALARQFPAAPLTWAYPADSFPALLYSWEPWEGSQTFPRIFMAVTIRLTRAGAKEGPCCRLVAADSRSPRDGRFIEQLGVYDPLREPPEVRVDEARLQHWLSVGAL